MLVEVWYGGEVVVKVLFFLGVVMSKIVMIGYVFGKFDIGISMKDGVIVLVELLRIVRVLMKGEVFY